MGRGKALLPATDEAGNVLPKIVRKCLNCAREFKSEGPWNRRCSACVGGDSRYSARCLTVANPAQGAKKWMPV